jgi:hypothetical protein
MRDRVVRGRPELTGELDDGADHGGERRQHDHAPDYVDHDALEDDDRNRRGDGEGGGEN